MTFTTFILGFASTMLVTSGDVIAQEAPAKAAEKKEVAIDQEALKQVTYDIKYMSSDEMGGRQPGTPGIKLCEDYIIGEYKKAGLKPLANGTYFQEMEVGNTRVVDKSATGLALTGPNDAKVKLELGKDFQQLLGRRDFDLSSDLVFVGYGITAPEHNYDDYKGIDVEGKIVVMIRYEPQSEDESSVFDGADTSRHSSGSQKVTAARRAKAAGIIMVNDSVNAASADELIQADRFRTNGLPFAQVKRSVLDDLLKKEIIKSPI